MTKEDPSDPISFSQSIWLTGIVSSIGSGLCLVFFFLNVATIFDYNGKSAGPRGITVTDMMVALPMIANAGIAVTLAWRSLRIRPRAFRAHHLLPWLLIAAALALGLLAALFLTGLTLKV